MAKVFKDVPNHEEHYLRKGREVIEKCNAETRPLVTEHMRAEFFNSEGWMGADTEVRAWYFANQVDEEVEAKAQPVSEFYTKEVLDAFENKCSPAHKNTNVGSSNYAEHEIQPWDIWREYDLNPWDADVIKRILRTKDVPGKTPEEARIEDYQKIQHICEERIAQLSNVYND